MFLVKYKNGSSKLMEGELVATYSINVMDIGNSDKTTMVWGWVLLGISIIFGLCQTIIDANFFVLGFFWIT